MDPIAAAESVLPANPFTEVKIAAAILLAAGLFIGGMVYQHGRDATLITGLRDQVSKAAQVNADNKAAMDVQDAAINRMRDKSVQDAKDLAAAQQAARQAAQKHYRAAQVILTEPVKPGAQGCVDQAAAFDQELRAERGLP